MGAAETSALRGGTVIAARRGWRDEGPTSLFTVEFDPWLSRAARMHASREALVTPTGSLSYGELETRARATAGGLAARGVRPGDRVALALAPGEDFVAALHGCLLLGAAAVPIDLRLGAAEREARMRGVAATVEGPIDGPPLASVARHRADAVATVMYTSGSTAAPKPVSLSYGNWLWNALGSAVALGLDVDERWLCPMPLAHVGGLSILLRSAIYGTTVVLPGRFDLEAAPFVRAAIAQLEGLMSDSERRIAELFRIYDEVFDALTAQRTPEPFRRFLVDGPKVFARLGERMGRLEQLVSYWAHQFPGRKPRQMSPEAVFDGLRNLLSALSLGADFMAIERTPTARVWRGGDPITG